MTEPPSTPDPTDKPDDPHRPPVPGVVQAVAILLYAGGAIAALSGLAVLLTAGVIDGAFSSGGNVLIGLLGLGLGRFVQLRKRWAQRTVLVLCGVSVVFAIMHGIFTTPVAGVLDLASPAVYVILLSTPTARAWFAGAPPEQPTQSS